MKNKGIEEFLSAARILKDQGIHARFVVAGSPDPDNPDSVTETDLNAWNKEGIIELIG
ncbi:MAG: glycosyltransferase family 1 protein, partial [Candidatus Dadabacteria bacterium]|nr:glycosyltransferase family 1 protein [Candidatus Dadabacteria bacterium]